MTFKRAYDEFERTRDPQLDPHPPEDFDGRWRDDEELDRIREDGARAPVTRLDFEDPPDLDDGVWAA